MPWNCDALTLAINICQEPCEQTHAAKRDCSQCVSPSSEGVSNELHQQDTLELSLYPAVACVCKTGCIFFLFLHILLINLFMSSFASSSWFPSPAVHIAHLFDTCTEMSESNIYKYIWKRTPPSTIGSVTVRRAALHYVQWSVLPFVLPQTGLSWREKYHNLW